MNTMHNLFDDSDPNLIETEHLLFEANAMSAGFSIDRIPGSTYYCNLATQDRWRGWSARAALNNDLQKRKINK